jgi:hypothetical protein
MFPLEFGAPIVWSSRRLRSSPIWAGCPCHWQNCIRNNHQPRKQEVQESFKAKSNIFYSDTQRKRVRLRRTENKWSRAGNVQLLCDWQDLGFWWITVAWDVTPCSLGDKHRRFEENCFLQISSETVTPFYKIVRRHMPEDRDLNIVLLRKQHKKIAFNFFV